MKCSVSYAAFIVLVAFETRLCSTPEATAWNYQPKSIPLVKARGQVDRTLQIAPIRSESKETCLSVAKYLQT